MPTPEPGSYRYWAFISYSSLDKRWARWLHRTIESYGVPAGLLRRPTPLGEPAPKRLRPVFHDRAELAAAADLGVEIEDALLGSRYLIVVCSPSAAESVWVNREIEAFQRMDRTGRILALIVDGEPNAGDEQECFPPALRAAEPAAADARPGHDSKNDARLRLLAGMLGVSFDALKQRDTRRRIRRLQAAVAVVLAIALGFAGLALYAQRQRDKAVEARQQAENLLEFLLFDLRDELRPLGRLDIVENAQARVDMYYQELGVEEGNLRALRNRAVAYGDRGDLLLAQDDLEGALREYRAALDSFVVLSSSPSGVGQLQSNELQRDISVAHMRVGKALLAQGDLEAALQESREAMAIRERLVSSDPSNSHWQWDLASSHWQVGAILQAQGDLGAALEELRIVQTTMESLSASDPENAGWLRDLAGSHNNLGALVLARGDLQAALVEFREALTIIEGLSASGRDNMGWLHDLASAHNNVGAVLEMQGSFEAALTEYRQALDIAKRLVAHDPSNAIWQEEMSRVQANLDRLVAAQQSIPD
ncbi:MAG: toll/interleukin-1 receptor domain-containing protein [Thermoleophilia bacterium]|nr:toll/interleukin-1 receptor domain-containing protein [Thermoleophilia bacterium]